MAPARRGGYDALSLHTLDEYSVDSPSDDHSSATLINYDQEPDVAKKEIPPPPSSSSSFSSPPMSATGWTLDTSSEFSFEAAPLLGDETPPPEYQSPRTSIDAVRTATVCPVRARILPRIRTRTVACTTKNSGGDEKLDCCRKRARIAHILFAAFLISALMFFGLVWSIRNPRSLRQHTQPLPHWAYDCAHDDRYNHYSIDGIRDLEISEGSRSVFSGTIKILPALPNQSVDLIMKTLPKAKPLDIKVNQHHLDPKDALSSRNENERRSASLMKRRSCGSAHVILHFREGLMIDNLALSTSAGMIQVHSSLQVAGATTINTRSGRIQASQFFNTRRTYINAESSSLEGHFKLYDLLSITSTSGRIDVTVEPQEVDEAHPKPAELTVSSQSGQIRLATTSNPPPREYITSVESRDGMIQGSLIHGTNTIVKSVSGMIQLNILPYVFKGLSGSVLDVDTTSGRQEITVRSPPSGKLDHMESTHTSRSGALKIRYPQEWAGKITGSSSSGAIGVTGRGVHIIEKDSYYVKAERDEGRSSLTFRTESGSGHVQF